MGPIAQLHFHNGMPSQRTKLKWVDESSQGRVPLGSEGDPNIDICIKVIKNEEISDITIHRKVHSKHLKRSIKVQLDHQQIAKMYPSIYHREKEHVIPKGPDHSLTNNVKIDHRFF